MKPSNYNFFFPYEPDDTKVIAYNSFSNALALMEKDKHGTFMRFCSDNAEINDAEFVEQLKRGNFIIDDTCNELDLLKFRMLSARYNTDSLGLTIAPTADCNFRCPYCYEKDVIKPEYMSEETQDKIIELVELKSGSISHFHVAWYGGEPLMAMDIIQRLSEKFIEICDKHNVTYSANLVTNGYFLTRENVEILNRLKISSIQVTMDGGREIHNKMRPHKDGLPTFDTIIDNLVASKDILPQVSLRINVDKTNISSAKEIPALLEEKKLTEKVTTYLGKILDENDSYDGSNCFNMCDFSQAEFRHYVENELDLMWRYPRGVANVCAADNISAHIVSADGRIYKCWADIGNHSRCVGSLSADVIANEKVFLNYMLYDSTTDKVCSKCNLLPVCMGGCPYKRLNHSGDKCTMYKFVLENYLGVIAKQIKSSMEKAAQTADKGSE
ncbi:MAG: SPASM domain-containing protein [Defluviitaleaceae bacterium]|nr:SPASM domain-containing protein [Defluviitaleaceae bacterium]